MDEPNGDPSCLPTYLLAADARRDVTVVVSGDGGDELFGGYETYLNLEREHTGAADSKTIGESYVRQMAAFPLEELTLLLGTVPVGTASRLSSLAAEVNAPGRSLISRLRTVDARTYLPGSVLAKVDRMSMASSLEVRSPLLSRRVATIAARLTPQQCINGTRGKVLLRSLAERYLPSEWMQRPKRGFGFPSGWLTQESLLPRAQRALGAADAMVGSWIEPPRLAQFMHRQTRKQTFEPLKLWRLLVLETWLQSHAPWALSADHRTITVAPDASAMPLVLERMWPASTLAGTDFNVQPDGSSALAVTCRNAGPWVAIHVDGHELATTYGGHDHLTALMPPEFYASPGSHRIQLLDGGRQSNVLSFEVHPVHDLALSSPTADVDSARSAPTGPQAKSLRIAFVLPRFMTEYEGGLATYVDRMTQVLLGMGHRPEVFCLSGNEPRLIDYYGVPVHRVRPAEIGERSAIVRARKLHRLLDLTEAVSEIGGARRLAEAVADEEQRERFDLVHCSDIGLGTLFVSKGGRPLLTRCSWSRDLYREMDEAPWTPGGWLVSILERMSIRRADVAYAPSQFLSSYMARRFGIRLEVLRPPFVIERPAGGELPSGIPKRYLLFMGFLGRRKGTDALAEALPVVWREEPEFSMVWAGIEYPKPVFDRYRRIWGANAQRVTWLGELSKPLLYEVLRRADASVLPSLCDNLPNAAIESLSFGVPVIGTVGTSLDELVEAGQSGHLVPPDDSQALAEAMLRVWRGDRGWVKPPAILQQLEPQVAALALLNLAGLAHATPLSDARVPSPAAITLKRLHPASAMVSKGFNVQPDGASALSIECDNAGFWTTVTFGGAPLRTTYGGPTWLTALVPDHLLRTPGPIPVKLRDERLGESNALTFTVEPN
jgi:glycosyltransferase involved in cell wall biosynthesis